MTNLFLTHKANPALSLLILGAIVLLVLIAFHSVAQAETYTVSTNADPTDPGTDRKSTRLNSSHIQKSRMPSSA